MKLEGLLYHAMNWDTIPSFNVVNVILTSLTLYNVKFVIFVIQDEAAEGGYRLIGDVCFEEAESVASAITPVPGGVGPVTVAMVLSNTLQSALRFFGLPSDTSHTFQ
jgi:5,10-methylene-tetrahydrofolate dehydrogenase/methenyl tetrahydrofolate cyclohydrolase